MINKIQIRAMFSTQSKIVCYATKLILLLLLSYSTPSLAMKRLVGKTKPTSSIQSVKRQPKASLLSKLIEYPTEKSLGKKLSSLFQEKEKAFLKLTNTNETEGLYAELKKIISKLAPEIQNTARKTTCLEKISFGSRKKPQLPLRASRSRLLKIYKNNTDKIFTRASQATLFVPTCIKNRNKKTQNIFQEWREQVINLCDVYALSAYKEDDQEILKTWFSKNVIRQAQLIHETAINEMLEQAINIIDEKRKQNRVHHKKRVFYLNEEIAKEKKQIQKIEKLIEDSNAQKTQDASDNKQPNQVYLEAKITIYSAHKKQHEQNLETRQKQLDQNNQKLITIKEEKQNLMKQRTALEEIKEPIDQEMEALRTYEDKLVKSLPCPNIEEATKKNAEEQKEDLFKKYLEIAKTLCKIQKKLFSVIA